MHSANASNATCPLSNSEMFGIPEIYGIPTWFARPFDVEDLASLDP
jgi:hypothetical protein